MIQTHRLNHNRVIQVITEAQVMLMFHSGRLPHRSSHAHTSLRFAFGVITKEKVGNT